MKIILHDPEDSEFQSRLQARIEEEFPDVQIVLTNTIQHLSESLCRPLHNVSALIAFVTDSNSITLLSSLVPLFENTKLILIFCKKMDGLEKFTFLLEPLYVSYPENNFEDIIWVLQRIEEKQMRSGNRFKIN